MSNSHDGVPPDARMGALLLLAVFPSLLLAKPGPLSASEDPPADLIFCNRFVVTHTLRGHTLELGLQTDLPEDTELLVTVSRDFINGKVTYAENYLFGRHRSKVADWKVPVEVDLDERQWLLQFADRKRDFKSIDAWYPPAKISDAVVVTFQTLTNQPDRRFGHRNANLRGAWVTTETSGTIVTRFVRRRFLHRLPLEDPPYHSYRGELPDDAPPPLPTTPGSRTLGVWDIEDTILVGRLTLYTAGGKHFMLWRYKDGSEGTQELLPRKANRGACYDFAEDNDGQYYCVVKATGHLEMADRAGVVFRAHVVPSGEAASGAPSK